MNRKERKARAEKKRMQIQEETLALISDTYAKTKDWEKAVRAGNDAIQKLIQSRPQEKVLILEATRILDERMADAIKKIAKEKKENLQVDFFWSEKKEKEYGLHRWTRFGHHEVEEVDRHS